MSSPSRQTAAAKVALAARYRNPELPNLKRDLRAAQLEDHIRLLVDQAPPLTQSQVDRLTVLLNGGASRGGESDALAA